MRQPFVHEALLQLRTGADARATGAAVTVELCGHWEHDGPCRWPHHTAVVQSTGSRMTVRTVFVCHLAEEQAVRDRIHHALQTETLDGPAGTSTWTLTADGPSDLTTDEQQLGARLGSGAG